jgi:hypothetical protein
VLHKKPAQVQFMRDTLFDDAGKIWCCRTAQTSSQHAVSAVTPQRAIINIDSAGGYTNELAAGVQNIPL